MEILTYPNPCLTHPARPVENIDDHVRELVGQMEETMVAHDGVGLAAPQVGVDLRVVVIDRYAFEGEEGQSKPKVVLINPQIIEASNEIQNGEEGCLSFPGIFIKLKRHKRVRVRALDLNGEPFEIEGEDLGARALQHEIDHLDGVVMVDHASHLVRSLALKRLQRNLAAVADEKKSAKDKAGKSNA